MSAKVLDDEALLAAHRRLMEDGNWQSYGPDARRIQKLYSKAKGNGRLSRVLAAAGLDGGPMPDGRKGGAPAASQGGDAPLGGISWTEASDGATVESPRGHISTLEGLLEAAKVDLSRWYVERWTCNKWDQGSRTDDGVTVTELWQIKAYLRPVPGRDIGEALRAQVLADMAAHAPRYAGVRYVGPRDGERHMAVISLADHHIGSLAWAPETGESYDVYIAEELAAEAMTDIVHKVTAWPVEKVLFILGNDLVHVDRTVDGKGGTTTRGTMQETDGRWQKMFRAATQVSVAAIDMCRGIAPVEVVVKAGNHDTASTFMLGDVIQAWYRNDTAVTVTNDPTPRSYVEYGVNGLGITHGHHEKPDKLPLLMATEAPAMWARTQFRDWLTGHRHRKGVLMNEESGVQIYTMPSLCAGDSWHVEQGYKHRRSSEARIYHHDAGPVAQLTFNARKEA